MHLLSTNDDKKWYFWMKQGRLTSDTFQTTVKDFKNKYDATVEFESYFFKKTSNKWADRAYF